MPYDIDAFDTIRPYKKGEMKKALNDLLSDRHFQKLMQGYIPWLPKSFRNGLLRLAFIGLEEPQDFQVRYMNFIVKHFVVKKHTTSFTFDHEQIENNDTRYCFLSNHRDIVLDSALLDVLLIKEKFKRTVEIAIGDNLLIYPWIKALVRLNKSFTVRRGLSPRELLQSSQLMSEYIHFSLTQKHENLWIAQREGRAKDSNDETQDSVLKMLAMGGKGTPVESLKELNIVPLTISYEYDPCDYLKAQEFQLKRDTPNYKKSKQDDLDNMRIGIFGDKGRVHYQASPCINTWIEQLADLPKTELYTAVAKRIDQDIHRSYKLFPGNYVACDILSGTTEFEAHYSPEEKKTFEDYLKSRIELIDIPNKDVSFLQERILTMYANPVRNKLQAEQNK